MTAPYRISPFIDPVAVEAWDAWFRWRDRSGLHDISIEDTWRRVAAALAAPESPSDAPQWYARFQQALSAWRLLPGERLLSSAGTGRVAWSQGPLYACLNMAGFVPPVSQFQLAAIADCAALAVRALDNAALIAGIPRPRLRIGLIGVAGALHLLGLRYDSDEGRALAASFARALAEGCFRASVELARERGPGRGNAAAAVIRGARRGMPESLLREAEAFGLRHVATTAITSQRHLAMLANAVADALDPLMGPNHAYVFVAPGGERTVVSSGYALTVSLGDHDAATSDTLENLGWEPQLRMRAAVQPFVDQAIAYPLLVAHAPDDRERDEAERLASRLGLPAPSWQVASRASDASAAPVLPSSRPVVV
jgi:ribonucleoside-diphosphate reductase alpha chain